MLIMILSYELSVSLHVQTQRMWLAVPDTVSCVTCGTKRVFFFRNWMNAAAWLPYWLPYINFVWVGHMILKPQQADTTFLFQGYTNRINLPANTKLYGVLHQGTVHIVLQIKWCIYGSFIAKTMYCILMCLIVCAVFSSMYTKVTCLVCIHVDDAL